MSRTLINIVLFLALILFAAKAYNASFIKADSTIFNVKKSPIDNADSNTAEANALLSPDGSSDYSTIYENDLFREERTEYVEPPEEEIEPEEEEVVKPPPPPPRIEIKKPTLILYGVMKIDDINYAIIEDVEQPQLKRIGGKRYKEGDEIRGFKIIQILPTKIIIGMGNVSFEVLLYDSNKPSPQKGTEKKNTATPTVQKPGAPNNTQELTPEEKNEKTKNFMKHILGG